MSTRPTHKKTDWTEEEQRQLKKLVNSHRHTWAEIGRMLDRHPEDCSLMGKELKLTKRFVMPKNKLTSPERMPARAKAIFMHDSGELVNYA